MPFPNPSECDGPKPFIEKIVEEYGPEITEDKFIQMCNDALAFIEAEGALPFEEMLGQMQEGAGAAGMEEGKVEEVFNDIKGKVRDIIVPFVAREVHKWLDQDKSKGVSQAELLCVAEMVMPQDEDKEAKEPQEILKDFLWSVLDKDENGSLSAGEISGFIAQIFQIIAKVAHVVLDTFSAAFKEDSIEELKKQAFEALDADGDGFIDEAELAMVKEGLEAMSTGLQEAMSNDDEDKELPLQLLLEDVKSLKAFADEQAQDGADLAKFQSFNREMFAARVTFCEGLLMNEEVTEMIPAPILAKIMELVPAIKDALQTVVHANLEKVSSKAFDLMDANQDGKLDKEEILGIGGLMDPERSADDKFSALLALIDTDGDKKVSPDELKIFAGKVFDLVVSLAQVGIDIYAAVASAAATLMISFGIEKLCGGEEVTPEKIDGLVESVLNDGPEALLGPLMEE
jgi:Ca2+-binding EF-hand superfamily protein